MKNSNDTIGNGTRDLSAQCLNHMRHRATQSERRCNNIVVCTVSWQLDLQKYLRTYCYAKLMDIKANEVQRGNECILLI